MSTRRFPQVTVFGLSVLFFACDSGSQPAAVAAQAQGAAREAEGALVAGTPQGQPWTGDFDGMVERRVIRALVAYSRTDYFLEGAEPRGLTWGALQRFEKVINEDLGTGRLKVHVVAIPMARDEILPALVEGRGDLAAANLTITSERAEQVDFSDPLLTGVRELVVTGPGGPELDSVEDLSGREVHVRPSSSYHQSLRELNERLVAQGRSPVEIVPADERLADEDLLEMVAAGLIPATVSDSHKAEFWAQILEGLRLDREIALKTDSEIAWAFRKESPKLARVVNQFVAEHRKGTLLGNIAFKRYLQRTDYVRNATAADGVARFRATAPHFQRWAREHGFDWKLLIAQGYQESGLDQDQKSAAGAVGVMQLLPSTAADPNVGIDDISTVDRNVQAGARYLRFILDRYFADGELSLLDQHLFAFAAYNAGPARVRRLRAEAEESGLDPNIWFDNVERIAARRIGHETVQYVSNIFKYYLTYRRLSELGGLEDVGTDN